MRIKLALALATCTLAAPGATWAHHSYAAIDMTRRATVQGTVTTLEWTNPHVWLWIAVADDKGASAPYAFESLSPSELTRFFGWNKRVVAPGQPVTITYAPFRNGERGGALVAVTFADGRVLPGRQAPPAPDRREAK
jgi:hypothetical protein